MPDTTYDEWLGWRGVLLLTTLRRTTPNKSLERICPTTG